MDTHTHGFLYQVARSLLDEEMQRFHNLEEKATKYLGFLSAGIAVYTFFLTEQAAGIFPPQSFFEGCACVAAGLTYAAVMSSWRLLFQVTGVKKMPRIFLSNDYISEYRHQPVAKVQLALARSCLEALNDARSKNNDKADLLQRSYDDIAFALWTLSLSVLFTLISVWLAAGGN
jgi:hypothetical protein